MDWKQLSTKQGAPSWLPARGKRLWNLHQVLQGWQYDCLPNPFDKEVTDGTGGAYIPLSERRPSVRTNLCRVVVEEAAELLFADTHWPTIQGKDPKTTTAMADLVAQCNLEPLMVHAAIAGSIGSIALLVEVHERVPRVLTLDTMFLTPKWDIAGELLQVTEIKRYKTDEIAEFLTPQQVRDNPNTSWEWRRVWDRKRSVMYKPRLITDPMPPLFEDSDQTIEHDFGFVPIVWIRNMCGDPLQIDGPCTFELAIDTVIEQDYLLSQGGRALRYAADPKLVLKTGGADPGNITGGAANALVLPPESDAKLLEINGNAQSALINHIRELRAIVLEQLHGNKTHPDRIAASQSGRAMEMMAQSLIWLADRLRHSYGNTGLLEVARMICRMSATVGDEKEGTAGLLLNGNTYQALSVEGLSLHWPPWFSQTGQELLELSQALATAVSAGVMSRQTASLLFANAAGTDPTLEWSRVESWVADPATTAAPQTVRTTARSGANMTRRDTA